MTQPRKEQIKDPKAKFSPLAESISLGGSSTQTFTGSSLTTILGNSVTGMTDGVEFDSPPFLYSAAGPFAVSAGSQISIAITGINSGLPIVVTFTAGDIVIIGGLPKLTVSRAAARINTTLSGYGVTFPVAENDHGVLKLTACNSAGTGPGTGSSVSIQLSDVTPGVLLAMGLSTTTSVIVRGRSAPMRGLVTVTPDDRGSYVALRGLNGEAATSRPTKAVSLGFSSLDVISEFPPGDRVIARMKGDSTQLKISYFRSGLLSPRIVTASSDFMSLLATDSVSVTVAESASGYNQTFTVTFSPVPTVVQDVVDRFNTAWHTATGSASAIVIGRVTGPYTFRESSNNLRFKLNGQPTITVDLTGLESKAAVISAINAAIAAAGQATQGFAYSPSTDLGVAFVSYNTTGPGSSIEILSTSDPSVLQTLGHVPGLTTGCFIARMYGNDEIELVSPFATPGASLVISATSQVMGKLGMGSTSPLTILPSSGEEAYTPPAASLKAMIPEIMEFGEVPTEQEHLLGEFAAPKPVAAVDPTAGVANAGLPAILNALGALDESFLPRVMHFLGLDSVQLGGRNATASDSISRPRIELPRAAGLLPGLLVAESTNLSGSSDPLRMYVWEDSGDLVTTISVNAKLGPGPLWTQDNATNSSGAVRITAQGSLVTLSSMPPGSAPWADTAWKTPIVLNAARDGNPIIELGGDMISAVSELLTARMRTKAATVSGNAWNLIWESDGGTGTAKQRIYSNPMTGLGQLAITNNAYLNSSLTWTRDVSGIDSSVVFIQNGAVSLRTYPSTGAAPWTTNDWKRNLVSDVTDVSIGPQLRLGRMLTAATSADRQVARINATHTDAGSTQRTLIATLTLETGTGQNYYVYRGQGFKTTGDGFHPYPEDVLMVSCNSYWDESTSQWQIVSPSYNSTLFLIATGQVQHFYKSGSTPWNDNGWTLTFESSSFGIRTPYTNDPNNANALRWITGPSNNVKAWGLVWIYTDSMSVRTITPVDSFNVHDWSVSASGTVVYANLNGVVDNPCVVANPYEWSLFTTIPSPRTVSAAFTSTTQLSFTTYDTSAAPHTAVNLNNPNTFAGISFIALGK